MTSSVSEYKDSIPGHDTAIEVYYPTIWEFETSGSSTYTMSSAPSAIAHCSTVCQCLSAA